MTNGQKGDAVGGQLTAVVAAAAVVVGICNIRRTRARQVWQDGRLGEVGDDGATDDDLFTQRSPVIPHRSLKSVRVFAPSAVSGVCTSGASSTAERASRWEK